MKLRFSALPVSYFLLLSFFPFLARAQPQNTNSQSIKPPQLLSPANGSAVKGTPEFFWTSAVLPRGFRGSYKLKVVPVSPGQSPNAALAGNPPAHQATMRRTGETYGGEPLKSGQAYAWCVQVVDANGFPVGENQGMSEVFTFSYNPAPQPPYPVSPTPDDNAIEIDMGPLVMTGIRNDMPVEIDMGPLVMTGIRNDMPVEIDMGPLVMTGIRIDMPVEIDMGPLVMTGIRKEQPKPSGGGDKTPVKPAFQEELKKKLELKKPETDDGVQPANQPQEVKEAKQKLDLPFKKPGTVDGANPPAGLPDGAQMKQGGSGKAVGDTARNKILGKTPSIKTPSIPEKPADDGTKSKLQQKAGEKKTIDNAAREKKTAPVIQPAGTK